MSRQRVHCNCIVTMMMRYTMCVFTMQAMQRMFLTKITSSLTNTVDRDNCQFEEKTILAFSNVILVHDVLKVLFSISANTLTHANFHFVECHWFCWIHPTVALFLQNLIGSSDTTMQAIKSFLDLTICGTKLCNF